MTQEEKQLLLTDICARLLYKPVCHAGKINHDGNLYFINIIYNTVALTSDKAVGKFETCPIDDVKPYLRPMSSMTDEEYKEYLNIDNRSYSCPIDYAHFPASERIDWLNKKMFDYRTDDEGKTMIDKGIALEAPEGMYN